VNIELFNYNESPVRLFEKNGEMWWVLKDICQILDIQNPSVAIERLDDDERAKFNLGRQGEAWAVNESGLYNLILRSDKPEAKPFRRWVTHEVLPSIRKKGSYKGSFTQGTLPHIDDEVIEAEVFFDKNGLEVPHPSQHRYKLPETISHAWIRTIVDLYGKKVAGNYFAPHLGVAQEALPLSVMANMALRDITPEMVDFIEECIIKDKKESVAVSTVYEVYMQWGGSLSRNNFGKEFLSSTGIQSTVRNINGASTRFYHGITLKGRCDLD